MKTREEFLLLWNECLNSTTDDYVLEAGFDGNRKIYDHKCGLVHTLNGEKVTTTPMNQENRFKAFVSQLSLEELTVLADQVKAAKAEQKAKRFDELVDNLLTAIEAIQSEFPFATMEIEVPDGVYGTTTHNLLSGDYDRSMFSL